MPNGNQDELDLQLNKQRADLLPAQQRAILERLVFKAKAGTLPPEAEPVLEQLLRQNPDLFVTRTTAPGLPASFRVQGLREQPGRSEPLRTVLPAAGGAAGEAIGRIPGAAIGGAAGQALGILAEPRSEETAMERAQQIGEAGAVQGGLSAVFAGLGRASQALRGGGPRFTERALASPEVQAAQRFGVRLTPGQATQNPLIISFESILERAIGTQGIFKKFRLEQSSQLNQQIESFLNTISRPASRQEAGILVREAIEATDRQAGKALGAVEEGIRTKAGTTPLQLGKKQRAELEKLAEEIETIERSIGVPSGAEKAGADIDRLLIEGLDVNTALQSARNLRLKSESRAVPQLSGALGKARGEILDSIEGTLEQQGLGKEAADLKLARRRVAEIKSAMKGKLIKGLLNRNQPESVGRLLANRGSGVTGAEELRRVLELKPGQDLPAPARRAFIEEILNKSSSENVIIGNNLEGAIQEIGEDTIRAVLPKQEAEYLLKDTREIANLLNLPASLTRPLSAESSSLLAMGQSSAIGGLLAGGAILGEPVTALAGVAGVVGIPMLISRVATKRGGVQLLRDAAKARVGTAEGSKLFVRLMAAAVSEE